MCTKWSNDGDVHAYFSPYDSPYDAYIAYMNALSDLKLRVENPWLMYGKFESAVKIPDVQAFDQMDYYERLGLDSRASQEDVSRAFRGLAKRYHPISRY